MIPAGSVGNAEVTHFELIDGAMPWGALREGIPPGKYCRLSINGQLYMSNTPMELQTNYRVRRRSSGDVLIAGLGLGVILPEILGRDDVSSVTVVEKNADVVALVAPHFACRKLTVITADIFDWPLPAGQLWDTIYFDIWPDICTDNLKEMTKLKRRFARRLRRNNPKAWMGCWNEDTCRYHARRGGRY